VNARLCCKRELLHDEISASLYQWTVLTCRARDSTQPASANCTCTRLFRSSARLHLPVSSHTRDGKSSVHVTSPRWSCVGTVENHGKMAKNTADFCENRKNHGKDTASNHRPKDHYTLYKIQHLAMSTIITCSARFSYIKFCHCGALTNSRKR